MTENESHPWMIRFDMGVKSGLIVLAPHYREEYCVTERWLILLNLSTERTWGIHREQKHFENTLDTSEGMHRCGRYAICDATAEHLWLPKDTLREHVSIATDNRKN